MSYGVIEYNNEGLPKCEICGKHFSRPIAHVRQKHDMSEREYKIKFGFDLNKGICSKQSSEKSREKALENYDVVIAVNLKKKGASTRFSKGTKGRTRDQVSHQTRLMLKERLKESKMIDAMKKSGEKLGKSGLGNKARWENK